MSKLWDDMERMFTANPQHFLTWGPNAVLLHELSPEPKTQTLSDLKANMLKSDAGPHCRHLVCYHALGVRLSCISSFNGAASKQMGKRLLQYNSTTNHMACRSLPSSFTCAKIAQIEEPPYLEKLPNGRPNTSSCILESVKLGSPPAEVFLQPGMDRGCYHW